MLQINQQWILILESFPTIPHQKPGNHIFELQHTFRIYYRNGQSLVPLTFYLLFAISEILVKQNSFKKNSVCSHVLFNFQISVVSSMYADFLHQKIFYFAFTIIFYLFVEKTILKINPESQKLISAKHKFTKPATCDASPLLCALSTVYMHNSCVRALPLSFLYII